MEVTYFFCTAAIMVLFSKKYFTRSPSFIDQKRSKGKKNGKKERKYRKNERRNALNERVIEK